jgi:hypothetical protein
VAETKVRLTPEFALEQASSPLRGALSHGALASGPPQIHPPHPSPPGLILPLAHTLRIFKNNDLKFLKIQQY